MYWEQGVYWQTLSLGGKRYGIRMKNAGTVMKPKIEVTVFSQANLSQAVAKNIAGELIWRFDLQSIDVPKFVQRFKTDKYLGPVIVRHRGMRPKSGYSLYEFLVITVMLQNTVVRRSVAMLQALFEHYGELVSFDGRKLWAFWDPVVIYKTREQTLRRLKLGYRAKTMKRQAAQFAKGEIDEFALRQFHDREAIARKLDEIYGVGPQSAWYMLFEFFHFYDALEHISPWERKIVGKILFQKPTVSTAIQSFFTTRYGEFCQLAFFYLFTDIFWQHHKKPVPWLAKEIRL
ncbi:MAG: hypothetical protein HYS57_01920 [Parcubacteria group bacterium]|nr:hypothetical protein [Parcubacteria group bacterium]